ncbi:MAG: glycosyltransferase, partial [candidate division Zixibacteria bacterium]|nr:glycosyltransferase [candidate division Zixibacteria bacterium]
MVAKTYNLLIGLIIKTTESKTIRRPSEFRRDTDDENQAIPIVCYAEDWGRLPSSTQHLMRGLSATHPILWIDSLGLRPPTTSSGDISRIFSKIKRFTQGVREVEPNIHVVTPLVIPLYKYSLVRWINKHILKLMIKGFLRKNGIREFIQWSSCPSSANMINSLGEIANVYYIGDEFSEFTQLDKGLVGRLERDLLVNSDLLLVVSDKLQESKSRFNPLIYKIPHGCDYEHFAQTQRLTDDDIPTDLKHIPHPRIGYYGLVRDWFDFEMLRDVFIKHPEWSLVLVGPCDTDTSLISDLPNVHLLGSRPYEKLPTYLKGFDVCLIPYRDIEITRNANPLKLLEYMASGKPIVCADLPSVYPYKDGLLIAKTISEFEEGIRTSLDENNPKAIEIRDGIACANSWRSRVGDIETIFDSRIYGFRKGKHDCRYEKGGTEHSHQCCGKPVVMHLIAAMNIAGAEKVILNLLSRSKSSRYDLRVTSFVRASDGAGTEFLRAVDTYGCKIDRIPIYRRWDYRDIKRLMRIIKRHNVKFLHTHGYRSDIIGIIAAKLTGIPVIATAHGFAATNSRLELNEKAGRFFLHFADKIISVSESVRERLIESGVKSVKVDVIENAVDFAYFAQPPEIDFRSKWGIGKGEIVIGSAGRLSVEKAHVNLIKAVGMLPSNALSQVRVVIAGSGAEESMIIETARKMGIQDSLVLAGYIEDMRSFYHAIDIFCLPSLTEGSPLTILEAAASGKPIVATDTGSIGKLITNNIDGYLTQAGDVQKTAECIERLIASTELRNSLASA